MTHNNCSLVQGQVDQRQRVHVEFTLSEVVSDPGRDLIDCPLWND